MKTLSAAVLGLTVSAFAVAPAFALSVTNSDKTEHTVWIDLGNEEKQMKIAPGKTVDLSATCGSACGLTAPRGFTKDVSKGDKVTIVDGDVFPTNKGS